MARFGVFFLLCFLAACGGGPNPDLGRPEGESTPSVGGHPFTVLGDQEGQLAFGPDLLEGSGKVRFEETLGETASSVNFQLEFYLSEPAQGKLKFISFAQASLGQGVDLVFQRLGSSLKVQVKASNVSEDWSSFFSAVDATRPLRFSIDVHNDEAFTHLIFWDEVTGSKLLDSAVDVAGSPGRGYGVYWGVELSNARVDSIRKGAPRAGH